MRRRVAAAIVLVLSIGVVMGQIGPAIQIIKTADRDMVYAGDEVNFTIFVNNTGDESLVQINISDDILPGPIGPFDLDPQMNYTYWFVVRVDEDLLNNATVEGLNETGFPVVAETSFFVNVIHPNLTLNKTPGSTMTYPETNVTYTVYLENTGDVNITAVNLTDTSQGLLAGPFDLMPGENLTYIYNATLWDDVWNNATAVGLDPLGNNVTANATAFVDVIHPNLTLTKVAEPVITYAGENITYTLIVENWGDVNVTSMNLTDPVIGVLLGPLDLAPGENATVVLNASFGDDVANTANASGFDPLGGLVVANASAFVDVIHPALSLTKTVDPSVVEAKANVTYTFVVENTGDVNVTAINITDPGLGWTAGPFNLTPGEQVTCQLNTTAYVTETNNATAMGLDILGNPVVAWDTADVTIVTSGDIRSVGYWKHQFGGKGKRHLDRETLEHLLELVIDESSLFEEVFNLSYENATSYLWLKKASMLNRSVQQCLACWLNWANGAVNLSELVDTDWDKEPDTPFGDAMALVEDLIINGEGKDDYERAKDICDSINNMNNDEENEEDKDDKEDKEEKEDKEPRGPPEDKGEPQGRGPPEDKTPPVKRGPPENKGEPQGRGPPRDEEEQTSGKKPKKVKNK